MQPTSLTSKTKTSLRASQGASSSISGSDKANAHTLPTIKKLTNNQAPVSIKPNLASTLNSAQQIHSVKGDGACLFRAHLAAITQDEHWLNGASREEITTEIEQRSWRVKIIDAINSALVQSAEEFTQNNIGLAEAWGVADEHEAISNILNELLGLNFAELLYDETISSSHFDLWNDVLINHVINSLTDFYIISETANTELAKFIADLITQHIITNLNIQTNNHQTVHLLREGVHYHLVAPANYFTQNENSQTNNPDKEITPPQDTFIKTLIHKWQKQELTQEQENQAEETEVFYDAVSDFHEESDSTETDTTDFHQTYDNLADLHEIKPSDYYQWREFKASSNYKKPSNLKERQQVLEKFDTYLASQAERDYWREINKPENYLIADEFIKNQINFDFEEEQQNNPERPLVSFNEFCQAGLHLYTDAINANNHYYAQKYNLNLNPKKGFNEKPFLTRLRENVEHWVVGRKLTDKQSADIKAPHSQNSQTEVAQPPAPTPLFDLPNPESQAAHQVNSKPVESNQAKPVDKNSNIEYQDDEITISAHDEEYEKSTETVSNDWLRFPAADARPLPTKTPYPTPEEYEKQTQKEIAANEKNEAEENNHQSISTTTPLPILKRVKRKFDQNVNINDIFSLAIENTNSQASGVELDGVKQLLARVQDASSSHKALSKLHRQITEELVQANIQHNGHVYDFVSSSLDAIINTMMENSAEFRDAFSYFTSRSEEHLHLYQTPYRDLALNDFTYSYDMQAISKNQATFNEKTYALFSKILIQQALQEKIDYSKLGLAFSALTFTRGMNVNNADETEYQNYLRQRKIDLTDKTTAHLKASFEQQLRILNYPEHISDSVSMNQYSLFHRTSSYFGSDGICNLLSMAIAIEMADGRIDSLAEVHQMVAKVQGLAQEDPAALYRIINGLVVANNSIHYAQFPNGLNQGKAIYDIVTTENSFLDFINKVIKSPNGFQLIIIANGSAHAISVSKLNLLVDGTETKIPVVFDANTGITPCYSEDELINKLVHTLVAMNIYDPSDPDFKYAEFVSLELTPKMIKDVKELRSPKGDKYGDVFKSLYGQQRADPIASNQDWMRYFPENTIYRPSSELSSNIVMYNKNNDIRYEKIVENLVEGYNSDASIAHGDIKQDLAHYLYQKNPETEDGLYANDLLAIKKRMDLAALNVKPLPDDAYVEALDEPSLDDDSIKAKHEPYFTFEGEPDLYAKRQNLAEEVAEAMLDSVALFKDNIDEVYTASPSRRYSLPSELYAARTEREKIKVNQRRSSTSDLSSSSIQDIGAKLMQELASITPSDSSKKPVPIEAKVIIENNVATVSVSEPSFDDLLQDATSSNEAERLLEPEQLASLKKYTTIEDLSALTEADLSLISQARIDEEEVEVQKTLHLMASAEEQITLLVKENGLDPGTLELAAPLAADADGIFVRSKDGSETGDIIKISFTSKSASDKSLFNKAQFSQTVSELKTRISHQVDRFNEAIKLNPLHTIQGPNAGARVYTRTTDMVGKVMAVQGMMSLTESLQDFKSLEKHEKASITLNLIDLGVEGTATAVGSANWLSKNLFGPSRSLSTASRSLSGVSAGVSVVTSFADLGSCSYAYHHAESAMEKKIAEVNLGFAIFNSSFSLIALAAGAAFPPLAPLFATVGIFVSILQQHIVNTLAANAITESAFAPFAKELDGIINLFKNPQIEFDEKNKNIAIVSSSAPYMKLVVGDEIKMFLDGEPFGSEFIRTFMYDTTPYNIKIFSSANHFASKEAPHFENEKEKRDYQEGLLKISEHFQGGYVSGYSARGARAKRTQTLNKLSKSRTLATEVRPKALRTNNLAYCVVDNYASQLERKVSFDPEIKGPKHVYYKGHPIKMHYTTVKCHHISYKGYSPSSITHSSVKRLHACSTIEMDTTGKKGHPDSYWAIAHRPYVYNKAKPSESGYEEYEFHNGRLFAYEVYSDASRCKTTNAKTATTCSRYDLSYTDKKTCFDLPDGVKIKLTQPIYELKAGTETPIIHHFRPDEFLAKLRENKKADKITHYGIEVGYPVLDDNSGDPSLDFYHVKLINEGDHYFELAPGSKLKISADNSDAEAEANKEHLLHFILKHEQFNKANQKQNAEPNAGTLTITKNVRRGAKQITEIKLVGATDEKNIVLEVDKSVKQRLEFDIEHQILTKNAQGEDSNLSAIFAIQAQDDSTTAASLQLGYLSAYPFEGNLAHASKQLSILVDELKRTIPALDAKAFAVHRLDLSSSPYHKATFSTSTPSMQEIDPLEKNLANTFHADGIYLGKSNSSKEDIAQIFGNEKGALIVPKIYRKSKKAETNEILNDLKLIGITEQPRETVPAELKIYLPENEETVPVFHFYDPKSQTLAKQYAGTEIRWWEVADFKQCAPNVIPAKVQWGERAIDDFSCNGIDIAKVTESAVTSNRFSRKKRAAVITLTELIAQYKALPDKDKSLFGFIKEQSQSAWQGEYQSSISPQMLLALAGCNIKQTNGDLINAQALLDTGALNDAPRLVLLPEGEQVVSFLANGEQVLSVKTKSTTDVSQLKSPEQQKLNAINEKRREKNQSPLQLISLLATPVLKGEALSEIEMHLLNEDLTAYVSPISSAEPAGGNQLNPIPEQLLAKSRLLLKDIPLTGIEEAPDGDGFICHTLEGVALKIDNQLKEITLLGVSDTYLTDNDVDINDLAAVQLSYQNLFLRFGAPKNHLFKMQTGTVSSPSVFINSLTGQVLKLPSSIDFRGKALSLSTNLAVLSTETNANGRQVLIVQDVDNKILFEVNTHHASAFQTAKHPAHFKARHLLNYQYLAQKGDTLYLGLKSEPVSTVAQNAMLPFINIKHLVLMPARVREGQRQPILRISPLMQHQLESIRLLAPVVPTDKVQAIAINNQNNQTLPESILIKNLATKIDEFILKLPSAQQINNKDVAPGALNIYFDEALTSNNTINEIFNNKVLLNSAPISSDDLNKLIQKAKIITLPRDE